MLSRVKHRGVKYFCTRENTGGENDELGSKENI